MSLLIKEVQIIDGEGRPSYKADVLVQKNVISAIGNLKSKEADVIIDGVGNFLAPGFIDVDTDSDHYLSLFTNPRQSDFGTQGVTTILGGECGASLAPLLYGTLESIRKWGDPHDVNVNWHTVAEFLESLDKLRLGVNFGTLVGHSTIRRSLTHGENRPLTMKEIWVFKKILNRALKEGAFGFSTGLGYLHGRIASYEEIRELVSVLKPYGGIYATHLRSDSGAILESVAETLKIAKSTGVKTIISHFMPIKGFRGKFTDAIELINNSGLENFYFDVYPFDSTVVPIYTLLPLWAQKENLETMLKEIEDAEIIKRIAKDLKYLNPGDVVVSRAPHGENLVGKNLWQIMENYGLDPGEALIKIMNMTRMRATIFYRNIDRELLLDILKEDRALIGSNGNAMPNTKKFLKHERSTSTFPEFLRLATKNNLPLEAAIEKITSIPANFLGLKNRGVIKQGQIADLVIINKSDYEIKETILGGRRIGTHEKPNGEIIRHKM